MFCPSLFILVGRGFFCSLPKGYFHYSHFASMHRASSKKNACSACKDKATIIENGLCLEKEAPVIRICFHTKNKLNYGCFRGGGNQIPQHPGRES